jgi:hypothetical protein
MRPNFVTFHSHSLTQMVDMIRSYSFASVRYPCQCKTEYKRVLALTQVYS